MKNYKAGLANGLNTIVMDSNELEEIEVNRWKTYIDGIIHLNDVEHLVFEIASTDSSTLLTDMCKTALYYADNNGSRVKFVTISFVLPLLRWVEKNADPRMFEHDRILFDVTIDLKTLANAGCPMTTVNIVADKKGEYSATLDDLRAASKYVSRTLT